MTGPKVYPELPTFDVRGYMNELTNYQRGKEEEIRAPEAERLSRLGTAIRDIQRVQEANLARRGFIGSGLEQRAMAERQGLQQTGQQNIQRATGQAIQGLSENIGKQRAGVAKWWEQVMGNYKMRSAAVKQARAASKAGRRLGMLTAGLSLLTIPFTFGAGPLALGRTIGTAVGAARTAGQAGSVGSMAPTPGVVPGALFQVPEAPRRQSPEDAGLDVFSRRYWSPEYYEQFIAPGRFGRISPPLNRGRIISSGGSRKA